MAVLLCDRCGDVVVEPDVCRCRTPYDAVEVRRRLRDALSRARATDRWKSRQRPAA